MHIKTLLLTWGICSEKSFIGKSLIGCMAGRPRVWDREADDKLKRLVNAGGNMEDLVKMFPGQSENNLRVQMSRLNLGFTHAPERVAEIVNRITRSDNLAHRLMILNGGGRKQKKDKVELPRDEVILSWNNDINKFNLEVPILVYSNLPGTNDWKLRPLKLQEYQDKLIDMWEESPLSIVNAGRQVGKDLTIANFIVWKSVTVPDYFTIIIAPAERQAAELKNRIDRLIAHSDLLYTSVEHDLSRKDETIWTNGSRTLVLPGRGSITGFTEVDLVVVNEAGRPELPRSAINDVVPMLSSTGGNLVLIGNPFFKGSPFHMAWKDPLYSKAEIWSKENLFLKQGFLDREKQRLSPEEYARAYCAQFIDSDKAFIPSHYIDRAQVDYDMVLKRMPGKRYGLGIDWGRKIHESVLVVVSEKNDSFRLEWLEAIQGKPLKHTENRARYLDTVFNFESIVPEYNSLSFEPVDNLLDSPIGYKIHQVSMQVLSKWKMYDNMMKKFADKSFEIPLSESELGVQIRMLEMHTTSKIDKKTGAPIYSIKVPRGEADDRSDAAAMALWSLHVEEDDRNDFFTPMSY